MGHICFEDHISSKKLLQWANESWNGLFKLINKINEINLVYLSTQRFVWVVSHYWKSYRAVSTDHAGPCLWCFFWNGACGCWREEQANSWERPLQSAMEMSGTNCLLMHPLIQAAVTDREQILHSVLWISLRLEHGKHGPSLFRVQLRSSPSIRAPSPLAILGERFLCRPGLSTECQPQFGWLAIILIPWPWMQVSYEIVCFRKE